MSEEKPRHLRILDRIEALTDAAISKINIGARGGLTSLREGNTFMVSGDENGQQNPSEPDQSTYVSNIPLGIRRQRVFVNIGLLDGASATMGGDSIYYNASPEGRPSLPLNTDVDVWALLTISATNPYLFQTAPPYATTEYHAGDLQVDSAIVTTLPIDTIPTDTPIDFTRVSGASTAGTYYKWIGRIINGEVKSTYSYWATTGLYDPNSVQNFFFESGEPYTYKYFTYAACLFAPAGGDAQSTENINYIY